jgi:outer membrane biosynthesis protein TonB
MSYISEHKTGLIGTIVVHALVLLLLLLFGFFTPLPLPEEEGILVNFGNSETGLGLEEPAPGESAPVKNQVEERIEVKTPPIPVKKIVAPVEKEALMTQDLEKTVAMESAKKKKELNKVKDLEKEKVLKEKREQQEIERQRQAEITRQKREEEQRLAQAAAEQRKANEIDSRAKNAFGGNGKGAANSKSTSQGVTFGTGNQGSPNGSANVDKYGPGGGVGNGPSFSLDGRSGLSLPKPYYPGNEEGIVVVQVTVDKNGIVTKVEPGVKGSNTANPALIAAAKKAALQAKFNVDNNPNTPAFQVGTITYRFRLD